MLNRINKQTTLLEFLVAQIINGPDFKAPKRATQRLLASFKNPSCYQTQQQPKARLAANLSKLTFQMST